MVRKHQTSDVQLHIEDHEIPSARRSLSSGWP